MSSQVDLAVCIVTHNQPVLLSRCVAACIGEVERSRLATEFIIVDNASKERYPERLASLAPMVRVIRNDQNWGFGAANNRAICASSGRLVLLLNDDAIVQEGSLESLIRVLEGDPTIGAVGPTLVYPDGSLQNGYMNKRLPHLRGVVCELLQLDQWLSRSRWTRHLLTLWDNPEKATEPDFLSGACVLIRRQALDEAGLFDEGFYYAFEDVDLCSRLRSAGWRILRAEPARVVHYGNATYKTWSDLTQHSNYLRSMTYYFKKHSNPAKYVLVRLVLGMTVLAGIARMALLGIAYHASHGRGFTYAELKRKMQTNVGILKSVL